MSPFHAERDVEIDWANCLVIRGRGEFRVPRPAMPEDGYSMIIPFSAHFGPANRDTSRRKSRPNDPIPMR